MHNAVFKMFFRNNNIYGLCIQGLICNFDNKIYTKLSKYNDTRRTMATNVAKLHEFHGKKQKAPFQIQGC